MPLCSTAVIINADLIIKTLSQMQQMIQWEKEKHTSQCYSLLAQLLLKNMKKKSSKKHGKE
jgi:sortase (surface protein transpeptidase)